MLITKSDYKIYTSLTQKTKVEKRYKTKWLSFQALQRMLKCAQGRKNRKIVNGR